MDKSVSKDALLRRADALLGEARRTRKSASAGAEGDRVRLVERAEDLERQAARLEKDAVSAKNGVFGPPLQNGVGRNRAGSGGAAPSMRELVRGVTDELDGAESPKPTSGTRRPA
jgi:hypothetical protein